jgi:penicillin-binding protein 1C
MSYFKFTKLRITFLRVITTALIWFWFALPEKLFQPPTPFVNETANGQLLSASTAKDGKLGFPKSEDIPDKFSKCITTFEDKRFFYHLAIDILSLGRAISQNIKSKKTVSNASTSNI